MGAEQPLHLALRNARPCGEPGQVERIFNVVFLAAGERAVAMHRLGQQRVGAHVLVGPQPRRGARVGIETCVFDAYGTLLDVHSAVARHRTRLGDKADAMSGLWRTKQLQYMWLRTILDRHVDFWRLTVGGLDFALDAHGVDDATLRDDLLDAYLRLDCYPEVPGVLRTLREAGLRTAILSDGSPMMLEAAVQSAGIDDLLDAVISVDALGMHKPSGEVYRLAMAELEVGRGQ